jgi:hypothetical protein
MNKQILKALHLIIAAAFLLSVTNCGLTKTATEGGKSGNDLQSAADNSSGNKVATNNSAAGSGKTGGNLADDIVGTWEMQNQDKTRFTFGKDGSLAVKQGAGAPVGATYTVLDDEAIEARKPNQPKLVIIIKISGDTMRMNTASRGTETLKRIG